MTAKGKLPDFLGIGFKKSGTSFLRYQLSHHPEVEIAPNLERIEPDPNRSSREVHFFDKSESFKKGKIYYSQVFNDNDKIQGEITPAYIHPISQARIRNLLPNVKLIVSLRNPVDRAYSDYNHHIQEFPRSQSWRWLSDQSFENNILNEIQHLERYRMRGFVSWGRYIEYLERLFQNFPRENILVLVAEQMRTTPEKALAKVSDFLGLSFPGVTGKREIHKRNYAAPISNEARLILETFYRPYNERLYEFLGYEIKEWQSCEGDGQ